MKLLNDAELERSWAVANSSMNRDRGLTGANGYAKELVFSPLDILRQRLGAGAAASWLDLCCGNGRALHDASSEFKREGVLHRVELLGVDLVRTSFPLPVANTSIRLATASLHQWEPRHPFDLITCVHGLHYLGDKLGLIARVVRWLAPGGRFAAHLDLTNVCDTEGRAMNRALLKRFRDFGLTYDRRRRLLMVDGPQTIDFGYGYLGADDEAGPNFTGQRAVNSHYGPRAPG